MLAEERKKHLFSSDTHRCTPTNLYVPFWSDLGKMLLQGIKRFSKAAIFQVLRVDDWDAFQTLNIHYSLQQQITKKSSKNCQKYCPLANETKGNQNQSCLPSLSVGSKGHASSSKLLLLHSCTWFFRTILLLLSRKILNEAAPQPSAANNFQSILKVTSLCQEAIYLFHWKWDKQSLGEQSNVNY